MSWRSLKFDDANGSPWKNQRRIALHHASLSLFFETHRPFPWYELHQDSKLERWWTVPPVGSFRKHQRASAKMLPAFMIQVSHQLLCFFPSFSKDTGRIHKLNGNCLESWIETWRAFFTILILFHSTSSSSSAGVVFKNSSWDCHTLMSWQPSNLHHDIG